jgi:hypothetical protein
MDVKYEDVYRIQLVLDMVRYRAGLNKITRILFFWDITLCHSVTGPRCEEGTLGTEIFNYNAMKTEN